MRIIFPNLTEKKNVLAFNFFLSVNEQFQESFLWDKGGGWTCTGERTKKGQEKQHYFSGIGFVCTTVKEYLCLLTFKIQLVCSRGFEIEMMLRSDICSPFSTCHSHPGLHCHTIALDAHNMTKQTSYCRVKL